MATNIGTRDVGGRRHDLQGTDQGVQVEVAGHRFRRPTSRDLAALIGAGHGAKPGGWIALCAKAPTVALRFEELIDRSVERNGAVPVLNQVLLPAMKEVGDRFGAGDLILPFVLQSAEVMKRAVARLESGPVSGGA